MRESRKITVMYPLELLSLFLLYCMAVRRGENSTLLAGWMCFER
jgi:hypothetical protein